MDGDCDRPHITAWENNDVHRRASKSSTNIIFFSVSVRLFFLSNVRPLRDISPLVSKQLLWNAPHFHENFYETFLDTSRKNYALKRNIHNTYITIYHKRIYASSALMTTVQ
jgi:hypothetical protein